VIYFVRSGDKVKIGYSAHVYRRIHNIRSMSPEAVVLGIMHGERDDERSVHKQFNAHRLPGCGEWFSLCAEIEAFAERNCSLPLDGEPADRFLADDAAAVGARLRELRRGFGMTQIDLTVRTGIPQGTISDYERGARLLSLPHAFVLRKLWAVSLDFMFFGEGLPPEALAA
jgi:DNA-binding XRE family transcriptional regulator